MDLFKIEDKFRKELHFQRSNMGRDTAFPGLHVRPADRSVNKSFRCPLKDALNPWLPIKGNNIIRLRRCAGLSTSSLIAHAILYEMPYIGPYLGN